jgi:hypothetical protein
VATDQASCIFGHFTDSYANGRTAGQNGLAVADSGSLCGGYNHGTPLFGGVQVKCLEYPVCSRYELTSNSDELESDALQLRDAPMASSESGETGKSWERLLNTLNCFTQ